MSPLVDVIIVNFNGKRWLDRCLRTLLHTRYDNFKILLVDNGSSDGSVEFARSAFPDVEILQNESNLGFSKGNNVGIDAALQDDADYVVLLNNDTHVDEDWLTELVKVGEANKDLGVLGSVQLTYDGNEFNSWTRTVARDHLVELSDLSAARDWIPTRWVEGSCFAIKRKVIEEIGQLDPIYFMYYEEIDYCRRATAHGYKVALVPRSVIHHFRGGTSTLTPESKRTRQQLFDRSYFIYHTSDLRRVFALNVCCLFLAFGARSIEQIRSGHLRRIWDLVAVQREIFRSYGDIRRKWKTDRIRLRSTYVPF